MKRVTSLRVRLTAIILLPVLALSVLAGLWQLSNARNTASDVFSKSLLSAALVVANDVALSEGDALSPRTRDILADTSGGQVFYHVYAPDGVIVAGYATPPFGIPRPQADVGEPVYFKAIYLGRAVSGVRIQTRTQVDGFAGVFTTTVWQDASVRTAFVSQLLSRSLIVITALILTLALIIWFGVKLGLYPLLDLQDAIERRSSDELSAIRRAVPVEVQGIVDRLNTLFGQLSQAISAQSEFISNAAHQLRNPIAGVLSLAEAVHRHSKTPDQAKRSAELVSAARYTAELTNRLLLLERAKKLDLRRDWQPIDLSQSLREWVHPYAIRLPDDVRLITKLDEAPGTFTGDPTMLREAVGNLIDNSLKHAGEGLREICVAMAQDRESIRITVEDDGEGAPEAALDTVTERFVQAGSGEGSGLGLAIAKTVVESHGGAIEVRNKNPGFQASLILPRSPA